MRLKKGFIYASYGMVFVILLILIAFYFYFSENDERVKESYKDLEDKDNTAILNSLLIDTDTYDAFGLLVKANEESIFYFVTEGTSHISKEGKIVKWIYDISTKTWRGREIIYDSEFDDRNVAGGVIDGKIFIFLGRRKPPWVDMG
jgi:hypothetical protein